MTNFYKTVSLTAYKNLVNSWVFWEFTNWSWRLLHSYFTRVWNGQFSIQNITWEGELSCTIRCHHFHFQYGSNHFRRVFKLPLFSSGVVHWTWLAHTDFFPSVPLPPLTGPQDRWVAMIVTWVSSQPPCWQYLIYIYIYKSYQEN